MNLFTDCMDPCADFIKHARSFSIRWRGGLGRRSYDERLRLIAARAPPGGQEKKSCDYNTAIRKDITMAAVKCRRVADGNAPDHGLFGKNRRRVQNASGGI